MIETPLSPDASPALAALILAARDARAQLDRVSGKWPYALDEALAPWKDWTPPPDTTAEGNRVRTENFAAFVEALLTDRKPPDPRPSPTGPPDPHEMPTADEGTLPTVPGAANCLAPQAPPEACSVEECYAVSGWCVEQFQPGVGWCAWKFAPTLRDAERFRRMLIGHKVGRLQSTRDAAERWVRVVPIKDSGFHLRATASGLACAH